MSFFYGEVEIGKNFRTGHGVLIREKTVIGDDVLAGTNSVIDGDCRIGNEVSIQTNVYITRYTVVEVGVFFGPCAVTLNDKYMEYDVDLKELLKRTVEEEWLIATVSLVERDFNIITVPTLIRGEEPEIDAIFAVAGEIRKPRDKVFVLESTVPPLTTQRFGGIIAENTGYKAGVDFGMAYSPERVQAPQVLRDLKTYPKIVGGIDEKSGFIVSEVYSCFAPSIIRVSSPLVAEIDKIIENTHKRPQHSICK